MLERSQVRARSCDAPVVSESERNDRGARFLRILATAFLTLVLMLGGGGATATAGPSASASTQPMLSIELNNSVGEVGSGDTVSYVAVLENLGSSSVEATVTVSVPSYVALDAESAGSAVVEGDEASWTRTVEAGRSAEFTIDATIGAIPTSERRVTTLVSVFVGDPPKLVVRTADAAKIFGVEDLPNDVAEQVAVDAAGADGRPWLIGGAVAAAALFAVLLVATILVTRSRRARPEMAGANRMAVF